MLPISPVAEAGLVQPRPRYTDTWCSAFTCTLLVRRAALTLADDVVARLPSSPCADTLLALKRVYGAAGGRGCCARTVSMLYA